MWPRTPARIVFPNLQVDATYEYSLTAKDACGESAASVRLVRLNDTTPPSVPIVAQPAYIAASKSVSLAWVPSSDNVQIDHYQILRNGVPLSATDATTFTDTDTGPAPGHLAELRRARRRYQRQHLGLRRQDREGSRLEPAHAAGPDRRR